MQFKHTLKQAQVQTLKQILAPRLIQMFQTFQMDYSSVVDRVLKEKEDNVFVEIIREDKLLDYQKGGHRPLSAKQDYESDDFDILDQMSEKKSLKTHLEEQLELQCLSEKDHQIALNLIESIDSMGYIKNYHEVKLRLAKEFRVQERKILDVLKIIHTFDPDGVGARTVKECLLIQIEEYQIEQEVLKNILVKIVKEHLEDLGEKKYEKIAKNCGIQAEGVEAAAQFIKENLNPHPGAAFASNETAVHITPSFKAAFEGASLQLVNLERSKGIQFQISDKYAAMLADPNLDAASKTFLTGQYERAKALHDQIEQRYVNSEKLAEYILQKQQMFLKYGVSHMVPLLQKDVAKTLGLSPSTVSRIVANKFVETTHGVFSLKSLCPRGMYGKTSARLKQMIEFEVEVHPKWSDQKITESLADKGVFIARRTVTKYRLQKGIGSTYQRNKGPSQNRV